MPKSLLRPSAGAAALRSRESAVVVGHCCQCCYYVESSKQLCPKDWCSDLANCQEGGGVFGIPSFHHLPLLEVQECILHQMTQSMWVLVIISGSFLRLRNGITGSIPGAIGSAIIAVTRRPIDRERGHTDRQRGQGGITPRQGVHLWHKNPLCGILESDEQSTHDPSCTECKVRRYTID